MRYPTVLLPVLLIAATLLPAAAFADVDGVVAASPTTIGQAVIGFQDGAMPHLSAGGTFLGMPVLQVVPQTQFLVVQAPDLATVRTAVSGLTTIAYVEDNGLMSALVTPNDAQYSSQYGPGMMGFPTAWGQAGYGSSSTIVALVDSGILKTHQDLTGSRMMQGHDYVNNDSDPNDDCGHGTHTSGTVGATTNNGLGVAGMSQARILHMKALAATGGILSVQCSGSNSNIAQAIIDATDQGAKVISMSIGGPSSDSTTLNAVNYAWNHGVTLVAAAGNDGAANSVEYPGAYPNVIAVSALDSNKVLASYSSYGPQVSIAGPGTNVLSTYNDGGYSTLSGTSMATPHVAGALALALSCAPSTTNAALRTALQNTAEDLGPAGKDNQYGYGLARADLLVANLCTGGGATNHAPTASFSYSTAALAVSVDGTGSTDSDGDALTYAWTFGDGAAATGATASHTYASAGSYSVTLTVSDGKGGTNAVSQSVTVTASGDPDPATPNMQSGVAQSYSLSSGQWVYRKIQVPAGATNLGVSMTGPGCTLTCSFDADLYVRQGARPTSATYDCRPYQSGNAESCSFTNPAAAWWYVGVYAYSGSGTVTVTATVTAPAANQPPTASFSHTQSGLTTSVSGAGSSDPNGDALTYAWTFGDGGTATGVTASHTYAAAGTYTVTLTVNDGNGGSNAQSQAVTVAPAANQNPTASFTHSESSLTTSVNGGGSSDPDGDALSYGWSFGDGASGTGVTTSHAYASAGTYTVTLTVSDGHGGSATASQSVAVTTDPDPGAPTLTSGQSQSVPLSAAGDNKFYKIQVPAGKTQLQVVMTGPSCGLLSCSLDADLYVKAGSRPTDTSYDCRPYTQGNAETCTMANPGAGWWYIRVYDYSGSGTVTITATAS
ncbi:MAG: PKD domain-containing protein [bacterium]